VGRATQRAGLCRSLALLGLGACLIAPAAARGQSPLFAFAQFSDVQANEAIEFERFDQVLAALREAGGPGALLPQPISAVFIAGDLVSDPQSQSEWQQFQDSVQQALTANGIPFLAVPGNHDQDEFGAPLYESSIAPAGIWDVSSAHFLGQNGVTTAPGWKGLRFVGVNNAWAGPNHVRPADLTQLAAIVASATAAGENVFIVTHYPHDDEGALPLAAVLESPGVLGYLRGHKGSPHASQGLAGIANPVWDLSSESVWRDGALLYYEVFASEIRVYVLELDGNPTSLPAPAVLSLPQQLSPAVPSAPSAAFAASPPGGPAPLEVAFADLSSGVPTEWLWDFGDGSTSPEEHPIHVYSAPGSYPVSLVATNSQGSDSAQQTVQVALSPPSLIFTPIEDARVNSGSPTTNFGTSTNLRARLAGSIHESYLRFDVSGLGEQRVKGAVLRLFVTDPSDEGGTVTAAPGSWDEATLTWDNAPGVGSQVLDSLGTVFPDTWAEFDVGALVSGEGVYDFGLSSSSSNSARYSSREGADPPQLVVFLAAPVPALGRLGLALLAGSLVAFAAPALKRHKSLPVGAQQRRRPRG
jgi:PKD repeat protein